jgi:phenylalanine-4-hydroxylase
MHTDPAFAQALVQFGECAHTMAALASGARDEAALHRLANGVKAMARLFWFTVEFGLMRGPGGTLHACGSGLLSSHGELSHAIESPAVRREAFALQHVIHQSFDIDHYQPLLFVLDSFEQLYEAAAELERAILNGSLGEVAPGEPETSESDVASFLACPVTIAS